MVVVRALSEHSLGIRNEESNEADLLPNRVTVSGHGMRFEHSFDIPSEESNQEVLVPNFASLLDRKERS